MPGGKSDTRFSDVELGCILEGVKAAPHCARGPNCMWCCGMRRSSVFLFLHNILPFSDVLITTDIMETCYYHQEAELWFLGTIARVEGWVYA